MSIGTPCRWQAGPAYQRYLEHVTDALPYLCQALRSKDNEGNHADQNRFGGAHSKEGEGYYLWHISDITLNCVTVGQDILLWKSDYRHDNCWVDTFLPLDFGGHPLLRNELPCTPAHTSANLRQS